MRTLNPPLTEGRPALAPETIAALHEVALWPGWTWWRDGEYLCARCGDRQVRARSHRALLKKISKAERKGDR